MSDFKPDVIQILTSVWNAYTKGKGSSTNIRMRVGQKVWDAFFDSVVAFTREVEVPPSDDSLRFKSAKLSLDTSLSEYDIKIGSDNE